MMRFTLTTSLVALAVLTAAAPQPAGEKIGLAIPISRRSGLLNAREVNIEALNSHVVSIRAKVLRGLKRFEENTGFPPRADSKGIQRRATGADALTSSGDNQFWYGQISVGTPPNTYTVDFDTGSSDLFLPGPECDSSCSGHTVYNPSDSSTAHDLGQTFSHSYEDGATVSGQLFTDTVSIAGLTVTDQTLGAASKYSSNLAPNQFPADGLMGLGFQSISAYNAVPVVENLISQGQMDQPVFSFKFATSGSELYLGGANSALYTGSFAYTPVTQQGFWQVNMDSVEGNGQTILSNVNSIIDTGTSLIVGKPSQVQDFYSALGGKDASSTVGQGYYTFPCDSFPDVSFTFGGTSFPISKQTLNLGQVSSGSSDCVSGIVGQDAGDSFWIVGDVFLQNVYTTFDLGNSQVGFAQLA